MQENGKGNAVSVLKSPLHEDVMSGNVTSRIS